MGYEDKASVQIGRLLLSLLVGAIIGYLLYSNWAFEEWFGIPSYAAFILGFIAFVFVYIIFTNAVK